MLARYTIVRGAARSALPAGIRQDTRKHTRHVLAPTPEMVAAVVAAHGSPTAWAAYAESYRALLAERVAQRAGEFDRIAMMARWHDVLLGCNCPSSINPDVLRCHTVLALELMRERYPDLDVRMPSGA